MFCTSAFVTIRYPEASSQNGVALHGQITVRVGSPKIQTRIGLLEADGIGFIVKQWTDGTKAGFAYWLAFPGCRKILAGKFQYPGCRQSTVSR